MSGTNITIVAKGVNEKCIGLENIYFRAWTLGLLQYEALQAMKEFNSTVIVATGVEEPQFKIKQGKVNVLKEGEVKQVAFKDIEIVISRDTPVCLHDNKYVFIQAFEAFGGVLDKETKCDTAEPFVKQLIKDSTVSLQSAYPTGKYEDYSLLFELKNLQFLKIMDNYLIKISDKQK